MVNGYEISIVGRAEEVRGGGLRLEVHRAHGHRVQRHPPKQLHRQARIRVGEEAVVPSQSAHARRCPHGDLRGLDLGCMDASDSERAPSCIR